MSNKGDYGAIPLGEVSERPPQNGWTRLPEMKALAGEFFGTATLVQIGCGANCVSIYLGALTGMWQVAAVWTLGATLGIYISAAQSGGHLNPAVTLAFALVRRDDFPMQFILPYWVAQLLGAFVAGIINIFLFTTAITKFEESLKEDEILESAAAFGDYWSLSGNVESAFHATLIEMFGTAFLCLCIFAATNPKTSMPPAAVPAFVGVAIGLMVTLLGPLTGAGINPARDMGPRLVTFFGHWGKDSMQDWLPYLVGPLIGGPIGAFLADHVLLLA